LTTSFAKTAPAFPKNDHFIPESSVYSPLHARKYPRTATLQQAVSINIRQGQAKRTGGHHGVGVYGVEGTFSNGGDMPGRGVSPKSVYKKKPAIKWFPYTK